MKREQALGSPLDIAWTEFQLRNPMLLQVRTDRGILPSEDPRRISSVLQRAVQAVESDRNSEAEQILEEVVEIETESSCQVVHLLFCCEDCLYKTKGVKHYNFQSLRVMCGFSLVGAWLYYGFFKNDEENL